MTTLATPHGCCVVLLLDEVDVAYAALHAAERAIADSLPAIRRRDLIAGRTALRAALVELGVDAGPITADDRGAPVLPAGFSGSISHKAQVAAAIATPAGADTRVGVDLERTTGSRVDISRRILTSRELAALPDDPVARISSVLLHFSIKEAIYKAVDPFVRRYVGFQEVELAIEPGGTARVTSQLGLAIEVTWREHADHWLTTARATR